MSYEQDRVNKAEKMRQLGFDPFGKFPGEDVVGNFSPMAKIYSLCFPSKTMGIGQFIAELEKSKQFPYWDTEEPKKQEVRKDITADNGPEASGFGRIVLRRDMGNLHFLTIRDHSGDCQIALSKKKLTEKEWGLAKLLDLGDIITFAGRVAPTQKEEPTLWATT
jgi:lysyl-tRNA synthetase class 2